MIPITSQWQDAIENIYRNPAYFKFKWFLEPSEVYNGKVTVVSNKVEESYSTNYSPVTSAIDANISEDNVASTEEGRWILDGSKRAAWLNNETTDIEYNTPILHNLVLNSVSDTLGNLDDSIIIEWEIPCATSVITILWDTSSNTFAKNFSLTYTASSEGDSITSTINIVDNNTSITKILLSEEFNLTKIDLKINQWSRPNYRARISEIILGELISDEDVNIINVEVSKEISIVSSSVPQFTCKVTIDNTEHVFDPMRKQGIAALIQSGAYFNFHWELDTLNNSRLMLPPEIWKILSYKIPSDDTEVILNLGTEWDYISGNYFPYKVFDGLGDSLSMYISDVLNQSREISKIPRHLTAEIPESLQDITDLGVPMSCSYKEALQYMTMPAKYYLTVDYSTGSIKIVNYRDSTRISNRVVNKSHILNHPSITLDTAIETIYINKYDIIEYTSATVKVETENLQPENYKNGDEVIIDFGTISLSENEIPSYSILPNKAYNLVGSINQIYGSGVTINDLRISKDIVREARIIIKSVDTLNAFLGVQIYPKIEVSYKISFPTGVQDKDADTILVDNSLITEQSGLLNTCNEFLQEILSNRYLIEFEYIGFPELEPGDVIRVICEYGDFNVLITKVQITFNGGFNGKISGRILGEYNELDI